MMPHAVHGDPAAFRRIRGASLAQLFPHHVAALVCQAHASPALDRESPVFARLKEWRRRPLDPPYVAPYGTQKLAKTKLAAPDRSS
jgi:hypothetical protein